MTSSPTPPSHPDSPQLPPGTTSGDQPESAAPGKGTAREASGGVSRAKTPTTTRAAAAWFATAAALVILVLLIILILQNQATVEIRYLGLNGSLPLGTALLIAAVAGAAVVTIVGVVRLTQLRILARRARRLDSARPK